MSEELTPADKNKYEMLSPEDFDAIVTGELTHYAIWLEDVLIQIISDFFAQPSRKDLFKRLLLRRDGLTFQDKIDIVRAMVPEFGNPTAAGNLKQVLKKIEDFKANRNTFAHGIDVTPRPFTGKSIYVQTVNRAGKEKTVIVSPETHVKTLDEAEKLLKAATSVSKELGK